MKHQKLILLIGGNEGDIRQTFIEVTDILESRLGKLIAKSSLYQTAAWGPIEQADFLNQALVFQTVLEPLQCLKIILDVEIQFGRVRNERYGPRTIDIDIMCLGNQVHKSEELVLPHPELQNRRFVLEPLNEIAAEFVHPILKLSNKELLEICKDNLTVKKIK